MINDIQVTKERYSKKSKWDKDHQLGSTGYRILGSIGNKHGTAKGKLCYENGKKQTYYEQPTKTYKYRIKGYLQVEKDTYVVVLGSRLWQWLALLLAMIGIVALMITLLLSLNKTGPNLDKNSKKYTPDIKVTEKTDPTKIILPGYKDIRLKAGTDTAYIALWNPETNPCYFKFIITDDASQQILYESGLIPPGEAVTKVTFNQTIPKGIISANMAIKAYDLKDYEKPMNGGEVKIQIIGMTK